MKNESFVTFMALLNQYPEVAKNPELIEKAAEYCGYKNRAVIDKLKYYDPRSNN